jgi:hypothetical protein
MAVGRHLREALPMMRAFSLSLLILFALLAAFVMLNWPALATPAALDLGFVDVGGSPGLVLLFFLVATTALFTLYITVLQAGVIVEARRLTREAKADRELADSAEASRFTELRGVVERLGKDLEAKLEESTGSLSAHLGEIEDRLDRGQRPAPAEFRPSAAPGPGAVP